LGIKSHYWGFPSSKEGKKKKERRRDAWRVKEEFGRQMVLLGSSFGTDSLSLSLLSGSDLLALPTKRRVLCLDSL
jgi:hypothetical protein